MSEPAIVRAAAAQVEQAQMRALVVARLMVGFYLLQLLLNLLRPRRLDQEPALTVLARTPENGSADLQRMFHTPQLVFWLLLVALFAGLVLQVLAMRQPAGSRASVLLTRAVLVALLGPFALFPLVVLGNWLPVLLLCLPTTAAALVLVNGLQQHTRLPWTVLAAAFGWGALVVWGFVRACTSLAFGTVQAYIGPDLAVDGASGDLGAWAREQSRVLDVLLVHLSVLTALAAAAGIVVVLLLLRGQVVDVVSGLAIGAAIGLGVNLIESVLFIEVWGSLATLFTGASGGFEYWIRQGITLLTGPATSFALLGAGLSIAARTADRGRARRLAVAAVVAAVGAQLTSEILTGWMAHRLPRGGALDTLILSPAVLLLVQAPFVVLVVLLLRSGLRARAAQIETVLADEVQSGPGAITPVDAAVLADPVLRVWVNVGAFRSLGWDGLRALRRLHRAQLALVTARWSRSNDSGQAVPDETELLRLRSRVQALRNPPAIDQGQEAHS